jgi:hypothetical protein
MPNWCSNTLKVTGPKSDLSRFFRENKGTKGCLSFERRAPTPEDMKKKKVRPAGDLGGIYGTRPPRDWYEWRIQNWGTKWDIDDTDLVCSYNQHGLKYAFDTAWSPPVAWLETVCASYPELEFVLQYEELGMGFDGQVHASEGEIISRKDNELSDEEVTERAEG